MSSIKVCNWLSTCRMDRLCRLWILDPQGMRVPGDLAPSLLAESTPVVRHVVAARDRASSAELDRSFRSATRTPRPEFKSHERARPNEHPLCLSPIDPLRLPLELGDYQCPAGLRGDPVGCEPVDRARPPDLAALRVCFPASPPWRGAWPWSDRLSCSARPRSRGASASWGWLTAGILLWLFDIVAVLQGQKTIHWGDAGSDRTLGLMVLAVLRAGRRCGLARRNWSWTNVAGWMLSSFWSPWQSVPGCCSLGTIESGHALILDDPGPDE